MMNLSNYNIVGCPLWWTANNKLIDPVLGSAIIAGGASLLSSLFGSSSSSSAAAKSLQATRETNETNKQIAADQMAWQEDMINQQNEYNSAASQVARYEEAGINPYMAMLSSSGTAGTQNQIATPVTPQISSGTEAFQYEAQAGQYKAYALSNAVESAAKVMNAAKTAQETKSLNIDNFVKSETALNDIMKSKYSTDSEKYLASLRNYEQQYKGKVLDDITEQQAILTRTMQQQELKTGLENQILQFTNEVNEQFGLKLKDLEAQRMQMDLQEITMKLALMKSQISQNYSQVQVNKAQVKDLLADVLVKDKIVDSYRIANYVAEQSATWVIDAAQSQSTILDADATYRYQYNQLQNLNLQTDTQMKINDKEYQGWDRFFNYLEKTSKLVPNMLLNLTPK